MGTTSALFRGASGPARAESLHHPVPLDDLLKGQHLSLGRLVAKARRHDVVVGTFTDEELLLCGEDADAAPDPHWQPYLHKLVPEAVEVAREACLRLLLSRGLLKLTDDAAPVFDQPHRTLRWAIQETRALVTWRTDVREEGTMVGGAFLLADGLVLNDDIDAAAGLHYVVLRPRRRQAAWLAALLDPQASAILTGAPEVAGTVGGLAGRVAELAHAARSSTVMAVAATTATGGVTSAVTAYGADDGLWLFQGRGGEQGEASLQELSSDDVMATAEHLLSLDDGTPRRRMQ